jgi:hypothetical protein
MQSKSYWENHKQNSHWEDLCSYYGCYVFLITHIRLPCQTEASHIGIEKAALGILTGLRWVFVILAPNTPLKYGFPHMCQYFKILSRIGASANYILKASVPSHPKTHS